VAHLLPWNTLWLLVGVGVAMVMEAVAVLAVCFLPQDLLLRPGLL
jgi:hypothetical protein